LLVLAEILWESTADLKIKAINVRCFFPWEMGCVLAVQVEYGVQSHKRTKPAMKKGPAVVPLY
jgi:hypothetical protein